MPRLVVTAVHATNHERNGAVKFADRGTGGLALCLADDLGASVVVAGRAGNGDANHQEQHPIKDAIGRLTPALVVDLHGMKDRPEHPVAIDIGHGNGLTPPGVASSLAEALPCSNGELFTGGRNPLTITAWAQARGIPAVQLEISASWRPPKGTDEQLEKLYAALATALRIAVS